MLGDSLTEPDGLGQCVPLADGVYGYIQPDGSWWINNAGFVVGPDFVTLIDTTSTERRTRALLRAIDTIAPGLPIRFLINTHHHGDHSFGNSLVQNALIIGHPNARRDMEAFGDPPMLTSWNQIEWGAVTTRLPDVTVESSLTLWMGKRRCDVSHVGRAAHTTGDLTVWLPDARVLFAGDLLFSGGTPFVLGGSVEGSLVVIDHITRNLDARTIVPGHGGVCGPEVVRQTKEYLEFVRRAAIDGHARSVPPLECASRLDLGGFAAWHDSERLVANLHRAYAEIPGSSFRVNEARAFRDMVALNGGPLHTKA